MKRIYLDTNVILSRWSPLDPFYDDSKKIVKAIENRMILGVFSGLGLAEVASVVARQQEKYLTDLSVKVDLSMEYIKKISAISNLEIFDIIFPINTIIADNKKLLSIIHWQCFDVASKIHLKTLDNLHITTAILYDKFRGEKLDYFVSNDNGILAKANKIKKIYEISVLSSKQLVTIEGL